MGTSVDLSQLARIITQVTPPLRARHFERTSTTPAGHQSSARARLLSPTCKSSSIWTLRPSGVVSGPVTTPCSRRLSLLVERPLGSSTARLQRYSAYVTCDTVGAPAAVGTIS